MTTSANPQKRRAARLSAVQALYQMDISQEPSKNVVREFRNHRFGHEDEPGMLVADEDFFEDIILGVVSRQADIDAMIAEHLSEKWTLKRLDMTLRAIMRAASYEIMCRPDVPAPVIIDEYVAVAADFFDGSEPGFVNGALDKIAKKTRAAEFGLPGAMGKPLPGHG
ncbi:MAG: transcription antitermination factor NusB [Alphaproteobacteria bacterium]